MVLVHERSTINAINDGNEQGVIKRFTTDNPVFPDDVRLSPINEGSCSEGSTCVMIFQLFLKHIRSISPFLLPEGTGQRSRACHSIRCVVSTAARKTQSMENKMGNREKQTIEETIPKTTE